MRIAVCAPQVPFIRGGAEILADTLVDGLRGRGHEAELVTVPFKWYPGTRVLDPGVPLAPARPDRVGPAEIDLVVATVGGTSCAIRQGRLGAAPVPPGLRVDGTELGEFAESLGTGPCGARCKDWTGWRWARRGGCSRPRGMSPNGSALEARGRGDAAPAAGAGLPERGLRRLRPLGQPARPGEADDLLLEAAAREPGLRVVIVGEGPDRERPRGWPPSRASTAGPSSRAGSARTSSPSSTRVAWRSTTRRWTRTSGWCRTRRSCRRSRW